MQLFITYPPEFMFSVLLRVTFDAVFRIRRTAGSGASVYSIPAAVEPVEHRTLARTHREGGGVLPHQETFSNVTESLFNFHAEHGSHDRYSNNLQDAIQLCY